MVTVGDAGTLVTVSTVCATRPPVVCFRLPVTGGAGGVAADFATVVAVSVADWIAFCAVVLTPCATVFVSETAAAAAALVAPVGFWAVVVTPCATVFVWETAAVAAVVVLETAAAAVVFDSGGVVALVRPWVVFSAVVVTACVELVLASGVVPADPAWGLGVLVAVSVTGRDTL